MSGEIFWELKRSLMGGLCKYFFKPERQKGAISWCVKNTAVKHVKILIEFAIAKKKFPVLNPLHTIMISEIDRW